MSQIVEKDDLYQEALLKVLERSRIDPEFLNQNTSYMLYYGAWMMKNYKTIAEPEFHMRMRTQMVII